MASLSTPPSPPPLDLHISSSSAFSFSSASASSSSSSSALGDAVTLSRLQEIQKLMKDEEHLDHNLIHLAKLLSQGPFELKNDIFSYMEEKLLQQIITLLETRLKRPGNSPELIIHLNIALGKFHQIDRHVKAKELTLYYFKTAAIECEKVKDTGGLPFAIQTHDELILHLGDLYMDFQPLEVESQYRYLPAAIFWYAKLAYERENPAGFRRLGSCLRDGKGVRVNRSHAMDLFAKGEKIRLSRQIHSLSSSGASSADLHHLKRFSSTGIGGTSIRQKRGREEESDLSSASASASSSSASSSSLAAYPKQSLKKQKKEILSSQEIERMISHLWVADKDYETVFTLAQLIIGDSYEELPDVFIKLSLESRQELIDVLLKTCRADDVEKAHKIQLYAALGKLFQDNRLSPDYNLCFEYFTSAVLIQEEEGQDDGGLITHLGLLAFGIASNTNYGMCVNESEAIFWFSKLAYEKKDPYGWHMLGLCMERYHKTIIDIALSMNLHEKASQDPRSFYSYILKLLRFETGYKKAYALLQDERLLNSSYRKGALDLRQEMDRYGIGAESNRDLFLQLQANAASLREKKRQVGEEEEDSVETSDLLVLITEEAMKIRELLHITPEEFNQCL